MQQQHSTLIELRNNFIVALLMLLTVYLGALLVVHLIDWGAPP
jgi:hypothetical protein